MTRNKLALWGLWAFLKQNKALHNQEHWAIVPDQEFEKGHDEKDPKFTCGTAACAAGWTTLLNGDYASRTEAQRESVGVWSIHQVVDEEGESYRVGRRAQQILGIEDQVAAALFHGDNEEAVTRKAIKMLAEGKKDAKVIEYLLEHNEEMSRSGLSTYFLDHS